MADHNMKFGFIYVFIMLFTLTSAIFAADFDQKKEFFPVQITITNNAKTFQNTILTNLSSAKPSNRSRSKLEPKIVHTVGPSYNAEEYNHFLKQGAKYYIQIHIENIAKESFQQLLLVIPPYSQVYNYWIDLTEPWQKWISVEWFDCDPRFTQSKIVVQKLQSLENYSFKNPIFEMNISMKTPEKQIIKQIHITLTDTPQLEKNIIPSPFGKEELLPYAYVEFKSKKPIGLYLKNWHQEHAYKDFSDLFFKRDQS